MPCPSAILSGFGVLGFLHIPPPPPMSLARAIILTSEGGAVARGAMFLHSRGGGGAATCPGVPLQGLPRVYNHSPLRIDTCHLKPSTIHFYALSINCTSKIILHVPRNARHWLLLGKKPPGGVILTSEGAGQQLGGPCFFVLQGGGSNMAGGGGGVVCVWPWSQQLCAAGARFWLYGMTNPYA